MTPKSGQDSRVQDLLDDLVRSYQGRQGFITAYRLSPDPHAGARRIGRLSVWESEEDAHRMASDQHDMSVQSELRALIQTETHEEHSFIGVLPGG